MPYIHTKEEHTYRHYNNAIGKFIEGKKHYEYELAKGGYVPFEQAERMVQDARNKQNHEWKGNPEIHKFLSELKLSADSKGNIRLGTRALKRMEEFGVEFEVPEWYRNMNNQTLMKGGWN